MKLLKKQILAKNGAGLIVFRPEEGEDLWHAFHLIAEGDLVRTTTLRKVIREGSTGSTTSTKIKISLTIEVEKVDFDAEACVLHIAGVNRRENAHVRLGAYHTLHLELHRDCTLEKDRWDAVALKRLDEACNPEMGADVAAIVMELGLGHLCLISGHMTITRARIEVHIPKKRAGASNHGKATTRFFEGMYQAVLRHIDLSKIRCVLVGSPGFVKDDFMAYMFSQATKHGEKELLKSKSKFVVCHTASGHKRAVADMLADPSISNQLIETKVVGDVVALNKFLKMLATDQDRAYYGYNHVYRANEQLAVETLLVTDTLFQSRSTAERLRYVALVEAVTANGGKVHIFSNLHSSGEQLKQVSGIAAILRFPIPDLCEDDDDVDSDDGSEKAFDENETNFSTGYGAQVAVDDLGLDDMMPMISSAFD
uniref:Protein pelota homolog n=1 Tax=Octactis speculum TaxID=3111310 RepID=A0A7S2BNA0_9STRA|mmetsp:Transcript_25036/g.34309  ORF Transcript_25036/g.34309 Transcript_25036/m.34309 type:complete len:425 (+) Transcript_25036:57-1331(+)|eukprot:CAMPEP_0185746296 /NCGR_PEP_ID=MMETSP1174-20130828/4797_1 /TAXON_ID=35687 /ORGANISM="Dictyocha speculum, Strain CCMP1381" /LENGTH=424 /DNA_ID=CAMNT_0028420865 /DNA_START=47 /DNA_END=1321 /DNA_ORIENTATION=+